jgi:Flp pilus assembly protein TadG
MSRLSATGLLRHWANAVASRARPVRRNDRGATIVEFALLVPILVILVMGIAEFGRAYYMQTTLSGTAREGVRSMVLQNDPAAARSATKAASTLPLTDAQIAIDIKTVGPPAVALSSCTSNANVTVTVSHPMTFITGLFGANFTLKGKAVMRCGG